LSWVFPHILVPSLIYVYIVIRFPFQAKWKKVQEI
jgi:hypothetical protein